MPKNLLALLLHVKGAMPMIVLIVIQPHFLPLHSVVCLELAPTRNRLGLVSSNLKSREVVSVIMV